MHSRQRDIKWRRSFIPLIIVVFIAFLVRSSFIWFDRPQFVGWFNHTYYYYVQTKGLMEHGVLPFPDMPLLFYLYALSGHLLKGVGFDVAIAIVHASRFWMCLTLAMLPIPVFAILRRISPGKILPSWGWIFVITTAFYPLTIQYIPEFLQKNALGLFLLATFIYQSLKSTDKTSFKSLIVPGYIFLLIILTHFGSAGAAFLYAAAWIFSTSLNRGFQLNWKLVFILSSIVVAPLATLYFLDGQRFERLEIYASRIFDTSPIGSLLHADAWMGKTLSTLMIIVPAAIFIFFYRLYLKAKATTPDNVRAIWLSNLVFAYLLVLPIYDQLLLGRFSLFLPLPLTIVIYLSLNYLVSRKWIRISVLAFCLGGVALMAFGEIMSLKFHNPNKEAVYADLLKLKSAVPMTDRDLIIARNGVEHISNWFLGTKSCVITSFNVSDFRKYERIFILNPVEAGLVNRGSPDDNTDRYNYMLENVREPLSAEIIYDSEHMKLLQLPSLPGEWKIDSEGNWKAYQE